MLPSSLVITRDSTLHHAIDIEERVASCPVNHTVKGMFFSRFVDIVNRANVHAGPPKLDRPPEHGKYVAFNDYPIRDYMRWAAAAAKIRHPRAALSEGLRRIALEDFEAYLDSGVGKVMLAFLTDARSVMIRAGQLYAIVVKGPRIESNADGDDVLVRYRQYHGPVECYPVGTLEGACRHFGANYEITVTVHSPISADYRVRIL